MIRHLRKKIDVLRTDPHLIEVIWAASKALVIRSLGTLLGFAVSVFISRLLGVEGSGIYYLAASVMAIAAIFGQIGFENTVIRFIASYAAVSEWNSVRFVYRTAIRVVSLASLVVAIIIFAAAPWLAHHLFGKPVMEVPLMLMALAVVPFAISQIQTEALRGLKQIPASQLTRSVLLPLGILVLIYPLVQLWQSNGAIVAYLGATVFTAVVAWIFWSRALKKLAGRDVSGQATVTLRPLFQSSWPLFGMTLTGIVVQQAATILLGIWGSIGDVGIFNVANRVSSLLLFPLMAMTSILAPKFAAMHQQGERKELIKLVRHSSAMLMGFAVPAVIVMFIAAGWIMRIFGPDFIAGVWTLRLLLVGVLVNVSTGAMGELLMMTGNEKLTRNLNGIGALVIVVLCFILIPLYGDIGAAVAVATGYASLNLLMVLVVKRYLGFWPVGFKFD
jgi:O-antigen/teichoic acid export membrane protein